MKMSLHCASIRLASLINFPNPASNLRPLVDTFRVRAIRESRINRSVPVSGSVSGYEGKLAAYFGIVPRVSNSNEI
jgi:hypothetical protein